MTMTMTWEILQAVSAAGLFLIGLYLLNRIFNAFHSRKTPEYNKCWIYAIMGVMWLLAAGGSGVVPIGHKYTHIAPSNIIKADYGINVLFYDDGVSKVISSRDHEIFELSDNIDNLVIERESNIGLFFREIGKSYSIKIAKGDK
jgi:hypothetical protein